MAPPIRRRTILAPHVAWVAVAACSILAATLSSAQEARMPAPVPPPPGDAAAAPTVARGAASSDAPTEATAKAADGAPSATPGSALDGTYRLSPGDRLNIVVFGHDDISGEFHIDGAGKIALPLLGQLPAAGRTLEQLQAEMTTALDRDFIVNPRVSIDVLNFRPFFILGQVTSPGRYPYASGMDVRQAVAVAGGFTRRARTSTMVIIREGTAGRIRIEATPDMAVLPGDTIEIERRIF